MLLPLPPPPPPKPSSSRKCRHVAVLPGWDHCRGSGSEPGLECEGGATPGKGQSQAGTQPWGRAGWPQGEVSLRPTCRQACRLHAQHGRGGRLQKACSMLRLRMRGGAHSRLVVPVGSSAGPRGGLQDSHGPGLRPPWLSCGAPRTGCRSTAACSPWRGCRPWQAVSAQAGAALGEARPEPPPPAILCACEPAKLGPYGLAS